MLGGSCRRLGRGLLRDWRLDELGRFFREVFFMGWKRRAKGEIDVYGVGGFGGRSWGIVDGGSILLVDDYALRLSHEKIGRTSDPASSFHILSKPL